MSLHAAHSTVHPLAHTVHNHRAVNNLQQRRERQRQRQDDVERVSAAHARGPDAHDDEVNHADQRFDARGHQVESRFEFVRSRAADFDDGEEEAEAGEGDDGGEDGAVDGSIGWRG